MHGQQNIKILKYVVGASTLRKHLLRARRN